MAQRKMVSRWHAWLMLFALLAITFLGLRMFLTYTPAHAATQSTLYASPHREWEYVFVVGPMFTHGRSGKGTHTEQQYER